MSSSQRAASERDYKAASSEWRHYLRTKASYPMAEVLEQVHEELLAKAREKNVSGRESWHQLMKKLAELDGESSLAVALGERFQKKLPNLPRFFSQVFRAHVRCLGAVRLQDEDSRTEIAAVLPAYNDFIARFLNLFANKQIRRGSKKLNKETISQLGEGIVRDVAEALDETALSLVPDQQFFAASVDDKDGQKQAVDPAKVGEAVSVAVDSTNVPATPLPTGYQKPAEFKVPEPRRPASPGPEKLASPGHVTKIATPPLALPEKVASPAVKVATPKMAAAPTPMASPAKKPVATPW